MPWHLLYFLPLPQGHGAFLNRISMFPPEEHFLAKTGVSFPEKKSGGEGGTLTFTRKI
jgi:hypothetical protein